MSKPFQKNDEFSFGVSSRIGGFGCESRPDENVPNVNNASNRGCRDAYDDFDRETSTDANEDKTRTDKHQQTTNYINPKTLNKDCLGEISNFN